MDTWIISSIRPEKESVYLVRPTTGTRRKFSVPGAVDAWMKDGLLHIAANTGYRWEIIPESGHRRRMRQQHPGAALTLADPDQPATDVCAG